MHVVSALLALLLLGCAAPASKPPVSDAQSSAPAWVLNPDKPGYQSVIGSAPVQDWGGRAAQFRVAEMKARKELAQMVRVHVQSTTQLKEELRGDKYSIEADVEMRLQSSVDLSLQSARVIKEWTDPQSGVLYIWMVTDR